MTFLQEINKLTDNKFNFLRDNSVTVAVADKKIRIILIYPSTISEQEFSAEHKAIVTDAAKQIVPSSFDLDIEFRKVSNDKELIRRSIVEFFNKNYVSLINKIKTDDITMEVGENVVALELAMYSHLFDYAKTEELNKKLEAYLSHCVCGDITVKLVDKGDAPAEELKIKESIVEMHNRHICPDKVCLMYGKEINRFANYICDCTEQKDNLVMAGKIIGYTEKVAQKNKTIFYCFNLSDTTGNMPCRIFTKQPTRGILAELGDGDVVIASGNLRYDEYSKQNSFIINSIARCDIDFSKIKTNTVYKSEPADYMCVRPKPYVETVQTTFFNRKESIADYLKQHEVVVFDFETTGLMVDSDMITEIGAVKLINGEIVEYFATFVNPEMHIPEEVTKKTGITDDMVKDAPKISEVMGDFFKFTRGAVLAGHNIINFDMLFLRRLGEKNCYQFDNNVKDTLDLSRKFLVGLSNYRLATVCESLGISLEGAHRAYNDCVANAKVFKHLAKFL